MGEIFKASGYVYVRQESDDENFIFVPIKSSDGHRKFALSIVLEDEVFSIYIHDDTNKEWIVVDINEGVAMAHDRLRAEVHTEEIIFRFQFPSESDVLRFKHYFDFAMFCVITGECILPPTPDDDEDGDIEWITSMLSHTELSDFSETTINSEFEDTGNLTTLGSRGENQCFTDSIMYSHAIVLKVNDENTSSIAAFRYDADGFVGESEDDAGVQEFSIATLDNKQICAKYALLTDTESHVLVQDSQYDSSLFDVDLSRGSVVQEYKAQDHSIPWAIQTVSATENDSVISCCSKNTLFGIDRRLRGDACVVLPHGKSLTDFSHTSVTNRNRFTCHATSDNGFVVVGDLLGQLRLFSGTPGTSHGTRSACHPKSARTLLPGLRRPLTAVDITRDGRYVVGTCDAFLVVVATTFTDENNRQTNGFEKRMGKKKKPPVRLELTPEQVALMGGRDKIVLRHATFELGKACARWIIATCGNATVRWSFDAVRAQIEQGTTATEYDVKAAVVTERGGIQSAYLSGTTHDEITPLKFITTQTVGMRTYRTSDSPIKRKMKS